VEHSVNVWLSYNRFFDMVKPVTTGGYAMKIGMKREQVKNVQFSEVFFFDFFFLEGPNCNSGWIDHNWVQGVTRTALSFVSLANGTIGTVNGDLRFTNTWYVVFNLFEMFGATAISPAVQLYSGGCLTKCFQSIHFAHNTFYSPYVNKNKKNNSLVLYNFFFFFVKNRRVFLLSVPTLRTRRW
jgi:hypothetical protein